MKKPFILIFIAVFLLACKGQNSKQNLPQSFSQPQYDPLPEPLPVPDSSEVRIAAYIRFTWGIPQNTQPPREQHPAGWTSTPGWTADQIKGDYLTDLMLSFANISATNKSKITLAPLTDNHYLWGEIEKLKIKFPHMRINLSVGGWGADHFSDMAHDPELRRGFVYNVTQFLKDKNLDGMDIDWEYPVGPPWGQEIKSRREDKENWVILLKELRAGLNVLGEETGKKYYLSACVPSSQWFVERNNCAAASQWVDSLKLMAYSTYGSWSSTTGHDASLYRNSADPNNWSTDQAVQAYMKAGVSSKKIVLGYPSYGIQWKGVSGGPLADMPGLFSKNFDKRGFMDVGYYPTVKNYLQPDSGFICYWDDIAKTSFLYNPNVDGGTWISYPDKRQIQELAKYAKEKNLGGMFYWEYAWDMEAELLQSAYESVVKEFGLKDIR
jgi:chitinase